nr:hypothetical protein [Tanacetum cinerariifolium]
GLWLHGPGHGSGAAAPALVAGNGRQLPGRLRDVEPRWQGADGGVLGLRAHAARARAGGVAPAALGRPSAPASSTPSGGSGPSA